MFANLSPQAKKQLLLRVLLILLIVGFLYVLYGFIAPKKGSLQITTLVPSDTLVKIDDQEPVNFQTTKKTKLAIGDHSLVFTRDGFYEKTATASIQKDKLTTLQITLTPANQTGLDWAQDHPEQVALGEGVTGKIVDDKSQEIARKFPLVTMLPLVDPLFKVTSGVSKLHPQDRSVIAIYIAAPTAVGRQAALELIKLKGFNPADYEIIFV